MSAIQSGDRINNYILQELVGTGSFGQVWKAQHHVLDQTVAIKIPTDPQYVSNLRREGVAIHGLRHENIVRALDLDPYADPPYLIMEFVVGPTLREVIDAHPNGLPRPAVVNILRGVLSALSFAHAVSLVHRDLKPANILLCTADQDISGIQPDQVKVTDFGLGTVGGMTTASIMQSATRADGSERFSGTVAYMSPEQRDGQQVDQRSDLYACGILLFEMLTGIRPQGNDLPSHIRPGADRDLDDIFRRCYTRLDNRYHCADQMLTALGKDGARRVAEPASSIPRFGSPSGEQLCRNCGSRVSDVDQFCIHCGQQLVDYVPRCPACQSFVYREDHFCIECGANLRTANSGAGRG